MTSSRLWWSYCRVIIIPQPQSGNASRALVSVMDTAFSQDEANTQAHTLTQKHCHSLEEERGRQRFPGQKQSTCNAEPFSMNHRRLAAVGPTKSKNQPLSSNAGGSVQVGSSLWSHLAVLWGGDQRRLANNWMYCLHAPLSNFLFILLMFIDII